MSWQPLLDQPFIVTWHAFAAIAAIVLGAIQLAGPKGTLAHRVVGYGWVALMLFIAIGSFWIHSMQVWGPFSPIHLLSILVIVTVPLGAWYAHRHRVKAHRATMIQLYALALIVTGLFTLWPGRVMHEVVFG